MLTVKQRSEFIKLFYLKVKNATEAMQVYGLKHKLRRSRWKWLCFGEKNLKNWCTRNWSWTGRPLVLAEVVAELHNRITADPMNNARIISRSSDVPKITVLQIAYYFADISPRITACPLFFNLAMNNCVWTLQITFYLDVIKITTSYCEFYGLMSYISL